MNPGPRVVEAQAQAGVLPAALQGLARMVGLGGVADAATNLGQQNQPTNTGTPAVMQNVDDQSAMWEELKRAYDSARAFGLSESEVGKYLQMMYQNGISFRELADFFSQLTGTFKGDDYHDWLDIATAGLIARKSNRGGRVSEVIRVMQQLSAEQMKDRKVPLISWVADAVRPGGGGNFLAKLWLGGMRAASRGQGNIDEYYQRITELVMSIVNPAYQRLATENKKSDMLAAMQRSQFEMQEAVQAQLWKDIYEPSIRQLNNMFHQWSKDPKAAFGPLWGPMQFAAQQLIMMGTRVNILLSALGGGQHDYLYRGVRRAETEAERVVTADRAEDRRKEQFENWNQPSGETAPPEGVPKPGGAGKFTAPGTVQWQAQMSSYGKPVARIDDALSRQLTPVIGQISALNTDLNMLENQFESSRAVQAINAALAPVTEMMTVGFGDQAGGGKEFSQLDPVAAGDTSTVEAATGAAQKRIDHTRKEIQKLKGLINQAFGLLTARGLTSKEQATSALPPNDKDFIELLFEAKAWIAGAVKRAEALLAQFEFRVADARAIAPGLIKIARIEVDMQRAEALKQETESLTGNSFIGQWGATSYTTTDAQGRQVEREGVGPSEQLFYMLEQIILLYSEMQRRVRAAAARPGFKQTMPSLYNAFVQRSKSLDAKKAQAQAKQTQLLVQSLTSIAGGAPAGLDRSIQLAVSANEFVRLASLGNPREADEVMRKYFDDLLPGFGTLLEHPDEHRNETVEEVDKCRKRKKRKHHESTDE